jgi:flagellar FliJ protein
MNDLHPLMTLLEQAEKERDVAIADRQRQQQQRDAARAQAQQLLEYRGDYEQRWNTRFATAGQIELVQCYHGFVVRLNQAVDHQGRVADHAERQLQRAQQVLQEHELRVASVRKLIERRVQEIARTGERREQTALDELASRAAWNRLAAATTRY